MSGLDTRCPCGHTANYHLTDAQQAVAVQRTGGKYPGECKGGPTVHCRCIASREAVMADTTTDSDGGAGR